MNRPPDEHSDTSVGIRTLMEAAHRHLGMDLTFLGEFAGGREVFRSVAGDGASFGLLEGMSMPLAETYCQAMIEGRIDRVVTDTAAAAAVADLEVTAEAAIGCYVGVPVRLPDGSLYGVLCGIGHNPDPTLGPRDARLLDFVAELVVDELGREQEVSRRRRNLEDAVTPLLDGRGLTMVFQPIVDLSHGTIAGFEALARFYAGPLRTPDLWFADAAEVGLGVELEMTAITSALEALPRVPSDAFLSINASAETALSEELSLALSHVDVSRVVLEITEHAAVANYEELSAALRPLRSRGMRLAVDDAGAGVASLHHILELSPELIKMDISLTRGIDANPARMALATALVSFGKATQAVILAEGIETAAEFDTVGKLGVEYGQGYLLGRPGRLPTPLPSNVADWPRSARTDASAR
ncbi:MAG: sensor domain-containing phosphodiesterase [Acidimicrobiales bacterium]